MVAITTDLIDRQRLRCGPDLVAVHELAAERLAAERLAAERAGPRRWSVRLGSAVAAVAIVVGLAFLALSPVAVDGGTEPGIAADS